MPDIIKDANLLLELVDEERADLESRGAEPDEYGGFEMWLHATVLYDNAKEVRESIKALAEEEYQYGVTYIGVKHGGHHIEWVESSGDPGFDEETLQRLVKSWKRKRQSPKVVRRRVSPVEVINE